MAERQRAIRLVCGVATHERGPNARGRREVVVGPGNDEERPIHPLEALDVVELATSEATLRAPSEHGDHFGKSGSVECEPEVLLEDMRLARARMPAADGERVKRALCKTPQRSHG